MTLDKILERIVEDPRLHVRWLNSLSLMENTGARKISRFQHKMMVSALILKHAAEEARHAFVLKKQIERIIPGACPSYEPRFLLAAAESAHYLGTLDLELSRFLKRELGLTGYALKYAAYLFVTYAIEVRAGDIYPQYQEVLTARRNPVSVKALILEEEGHLKEMKSQMERFSADWEPVASVAMGLETALFDQWLAKVTKETGAAVPV